MTTSPACTVASLCRYPVKGLSAESLDSVDVAIGETFPEDRVWAIENGLGRFDPQAPRHLPKINFLMLMRDERLATLTTQYNAPTQTLTVLRSGRQVARGNLGTVIGRNMVEQFLAAYMKDSLRGAPKFVSAPQHHFTDMAAKCVHIVNLASVRELERVAGRAIDPLRFRANIYLDGLEPWAEFRWLGKELKVGDGTVRLSVFHRTQRCDAINVDPATGARDTALPALLMRTWGHADFGIYARIVASGRINRADTVTQV